jgi:hypothetical protein
LLSSSGTVQFGGTVALLICGTGTLFVGSFADAGVPLNAGFGVGAAGIAGVNKLLLDVLDVDVGFAGVKRLLLNELEAGTDEIFANGLVAGSSDVCV